MDDLSARLAQQFETTHTIQFEITGAGMSRVFVAEERALSRKVVIKVLSPALAAAVSVERFEREIMVLAGLNHPNVVPVLSAGTIGALPYFIMPFVSGESLRVRMARGPLSIRETVGVLRDVTRALAYAHAAASSIVTSSRTTSCSPARRRLSRISVWQRRYPHRETALRRKDSPLPVWGYR